MPKRQRVVAVVDDDPSTLRAIEALLDAHGWAAKAFASGEAFLDFGVSAEIDCLLLDVHLGGISGIELQRQLTASGRILPVIFMTALADEAVRREALTVGCIAYLTKPFPARQLFEAIDKAVA